MSAVVPQGAELIVRLPPFRGVLRDAVGVPWARCAALKRQHTETLRPMAVELCATGGQPEVRGGGMPIACMRSQPIVPGTQAGSAIKKAHRQRRASFGPAG